jgi:hypothetical protein
MASLVESELRNLQTAEARSLGYFQMLVSAWDKGDYAGFSQQPELQVKWFIDTAVALKQGATVRQNPTSLGTWIAEVERLAHPDAIERHTVADYQATLSEARHLLRMGCDR